VEPACAVRVGLARAARVGAACAARVGPACAARVGPALAVVGMALAFSVGAALGGAGDARHVDGGWRNPLRKLGYFGSPLVETTPFVFADRLYLLENWQASFDHPDQKAGFKRHEDVVRIRDVERDRVVATPLKGHGLGTAFVWEGRVYVFASEWSRDADPWHAERVTMVGSADLVSWSEPRTVLQAENGERIFNTAVCRGPDGFVLLYETNDKRWPPFTFKYCKSDDLVKWERIPGALYGTDKYVGGPALYREGDYYYTLYLQDLGGKWETRVTRSKDLVHWQDAPDGRPFVTFDPARGHLPLRPVEAREDNASDAELCYWKGKTIVYFTGSDQQRAGDLQRAEFEGTPRQLLESFFASK
jgi:alpha-L-fucosidase